MNKKQISRRGFLKGIGQTAIAATLANILKFVPEAQEVFANNLLTKGSVTVEELTGQALKEAARNSLAYGDSVTVESFLTARGYQRQVDKSRGLKVTIHDDKLGSGREGILITVPYEKGEQQANLIYASSPGAITRVGADIREYSRGLIAADVYEVQDGTVRFDVRLERGSNGEIHAITSDGRTTTIDLPQRGVTTQQDDCLTCQQVCSALYSLGCGLSGIVACTLICAPIGGLACPAICAVVYLVLCIIGGYNSCNVICGPVLGYC